MTKHTPQIQTTTVFYNQRSFELEYFFRKGEKETIVFVHGLGGAKENFWEACKADVLKDYTLVAFDNPGTGGSTYYEDHPLDVDDLASITDLFLEQLNLTLFILVGASMGGLITLLYLQRYKSKVKGYINIEGNFMLEDCMFSSKVVKLDFDTFVKVAFPQTVINMKAYGNTGYHVIANNLQLNTNVKSYYHYSFKTVSYSATGELFRQYLSLEIPRIFIYGDENEDLSYLCELRKNKMQIKAISKSNHFMFYDNPKELYDVIYSFIKQL